MISVADANALMKANQDLFQVLVAERTAVESELIPVNTYILLSALQCYSGFPERMRTIDAHKNIEEVSRCARRLGSEIKQVHYWMISTLYLMGRSIFHMMNKTTAADDRDDTLTVMDFWSRGGRAYRNDGTLIARDAGDVVRVLEPDVLDAVIDDLVPVGDAERAALAKLNAALGAYTFLMHFETRIGYADTGPYPVDRAGISGALVTREFTELGQTSFAWSDVASSLEHGRVGLAFVLDDNVRATITDFGTLVTDPEHYIPRITHAALYVFDDGEPRVVPFSEADAIVAPVRKVHVALYRTIAAMDRKQRIVSGAEVYYESLRPFAREAGCDDAIDWSFSSEVLKMLPAMEGLSAMMSSAGRSGKQTSQEALERGPSPAAGFAPIPEE